MRALCLTAIVGLTLVGTGCQERRPPEPEAPQVVPITEETVGAVRDRYRKADPNAQVGLVTQTLDDAHLAAVGQVDVKAFKEGDSISFLDGSENFLTQGKIVRILEDSVHVSVDPPAEGARYPQKGDLAVRFTK